jgi:hypothetical protein
VRFTLSNLQPIHPTQDIAFTSGNISPFRVSLHPLSAVKMRVIAASNTAESPQVPSPTVPSGSLEGRENSQRIPSSTHREARIQIGDSIFFITASWWNCGLQTQTSAALARSRLTKSRLGSAFQSVQEQPLEC